MVRTPSPQVSLTQPLDIGTDMTPDDRYNLLGVNLGRYKVLEAVGSGGSGRVYRARDPELGRDVALKVLPPDRTRSPGFVERFRHEARAVARLSHPNILKVYDYGQDSGYAFIVTELIAGGTLQAHLGRPLSVQTVLRIVAPLADALDYAHSQGVVHSDLKPSNILMDTGDRPILADFGLARMLDAKSYVTNQTSVLGTPEYIAPEVVLGKPAEPRSDVYAFGVLLYEMLLARAPFQADTPVATALAHVTEPVRFPNDAMNGSQRLPPGVRHILLKALAKDAADRYQRAGELVTVLARTTEIGDRETQTLNMPSPSSNGRPVLVNSKAGYLGGKPDPAQVRPIPANGHTSNSGPKKASKQINVFIVEDHAFVLDALRAVVEDDDSLAVVGDAASGEDALQRLEQVRPDVVVMDITLPGLSGIEATKQIKSRWPDIQVLILSGHGEQFLTEAIAAGADGYIMKTADTGQVRRAIHEVNSGGSPIDLNLARTLFKKVAENTGISFDPPNP